MITGKYDELVMIVEKNKCPTHDNPLVVAWHNEENSYVVRCGDNHYPEEVEALVSRTSQYKQGTLAKVDPDFHLLPKADLATGEILNKETIMGLVRFADRYHLDAYRGHVVLFFGQPYIGIDGYLYHANKSGKPYKLESRPLGETDRKLYKIEEVDHAWLATVYLDDGKSSFTGLGIVPQVEMTEKSKKKPDRLRSPVVAAHPWQLAQKRAEWQAMRRAFPIGESPEEGRL